MWIPSEKTEKVLNSIVKSAEENNLFDQENLTMPKLALQGDLPDILKHTAVHFLGKDENIHNNVLKMSDVTEDERGLKKLIEAGCYRDAVNLTGRLLAVYAQECERINQPNRHTPQSLQLWYTRLSMLSKLKKYDILEIESIPFEDLDKPDMYFKFYPEVYGSMSGSMAPFSLRLLLAEIPRYCGKYTIALDNLHVILVITNKIIESLKSSPNIETSDSKDYLDNKENGIILWNLRKSHILISIVNCAVGMKNYILAIDVLKILYGLSNWTTEQLDMINCAIGRIHLYLGDVSAAETYFKNNNSLKSMLSVSKLIDSGLTAVAQNAFQDAYSCFQAANVIDPFNIMLINNMAICLLYTGQLRASVHLYETTVAKNPLKSLQESTLLNMCTSYELHTTQSMQTKLNFLKQLNRNKGDIIDVQCLKLNL
ncbi:trafficking protein particle complex subunit 12 isoform X2 [Prorops nasuta]